MSPKRHITSSTKTRLRKKNRCLDRMEPQCPICRDEFSPLDTHPLRVESDSLSSTTAAPRVDTQLQGLINAIAKIANGNTATVEETQRIIDQCDAYHNSQPKSSPVRDCAKSVHKLTNWHIQHTPIGVSYLLLSTLLDARKKHSELAAARDDTRDRLTMELDAVRLQYETLIQVRRNDKETVLRNEDAFRAHCDEMSARWKRSVVLLNRQFQWIAR